MPRRYRPAKRKIEPDIRYGSVAVEKFINRMMMGGKKSISRRIMYDALSSIEERTGKPALEVFEEAMNNVMPSVEVRARRVGGSTYQVPTEVDSYRRKSLGIRWLLLAARNRGERGMSNKLAAELLDAANGAGSAVKRREEIYRMAEANRAFAHLRW
ncbi:MAG: 30S ribosomal protein S7 [Chloroflexota bacterium]|nr:30S ribosomal protein S7 [Chloroflexota bacterium]